jgi:5-methylcytosine-specific restriction endonuclease McrA
MDIPYSTLPPRKKPVRKVRAKARPGRLKGKAMTALRIACFERDKGMCQECGRFPGWWWGEMAHIRAKRNNGDTLDNVRWLCSRCHMIEHSYGKSGVKPVPKKPSDSTRIEG